MSDKWISAHGIFLMNIRFVQVNLCHINTVQKKKQHDHFSRCRKCICQHSTSFYDKNCQQSNNKMQNNNIPYY